MNYIETERTLAALEDAVSDAKRYDDNRRGGEYNKAISNINTEFERLRELLGY